MFFISLISERNHDGEYTNASIGRISFWITFLFAVWLWATTDKDIQPAHMQMLYITASYNLLKKSKHFLNKKDIE